jgi:peptidoglycan/LPS O-acetylase OafA/YrhL
MPARRTDGERQIRYRPEIDGLRAVAVLPVILFHAGFEWFSGGYVGVDVFFVISGYLITSILLEDLATGRFSIGHFYERRARRLLPALFLVLFCTSIAGWLWMVPEQFEEYSRTLVAVVLFASNIYFWRTQDYFAPVAELNPLLHTWSLALEEQFYLGFPILLLAVWSVARHRLLLTMVALSLVSLMLAEWGWRNRPAANFFLLPTRAWELGAGSICAIILRDMRPRTSTLLPLLGLGLIAFSIFAFDADTPFPSVCALAPVAGTALVILYAGAGAPAAWLLALPPLVSLGLISYSAYLGISRSSLSPASAR